MSWEPELLIKVPAITICESAFSNVPAHPTQHKSRGDSCNRNEERFSKVSNGGGIPESRERDPESQQNSCSVQERIKAFESLGGLLLCFNYNHRLELKYSTVACSLRPAARNMNADPKPQKQPASIQDGKKRLPFVPPAFNNAPEQPTQHKSRRDTCNRNEERFSKTSNGKGIQESRERDPESQHQFSIVQKRRKNFESAALSHGPKKAPKMESGVDSHRRLQERLSRQSKGNADPVILERALSHGPMKAPKMESGVDSHKSVQERFSKQSKGNADPVILERAFSNVPAHPTQHKSRGDTCNRNEERFSKTSSGGGIPESRERDPESQHQFSIVQERRKNFESPALSHGPMKAPKMESGVDSHKSVQERFSKQSKGNADPVILERGNWSCEKTCAHHVEPSSQGRTVETNTSWGQESMREEMEKILSEKLAVLQRQLEMTQQAIPPMKEMTNTWASLQKLPENMQALQKGLENLQVSTKEDLQTLRADLEERVPKAWNTPEMPESKENLVEVENQAGRTVETNTSWGQESMREEMEKILSEKLAVLQRQLEMTQQAIPPMKEMTNTWASLQKLPENMQALQKGLENLQVSTKEDLQTLRADLEERVPKAWNTPEMPESKENLVEVENQAGRTVETNTSWGQESMREEMEKILSEKLAVLQRQLEMTQQAIPPMKEMTNTWASLQKLPENMQALQKGLENLQVSTKEDLQTLRADLEERVPKAWNTPEMPESKENLVEVENQAGRTVETNTSWGQESMREEMEKILSEKLAVLQRQLEMAQQAIPPMKEMTNTWASLQKLPENMQALQKGLENLQVSTKEDLQMLRADLEERVPKAGNTPEMPESKENLVEVENQAGRKVEMTSVAMESMREEMEKILSEKLALLQRQLEMTQQAIPPMKEMTNTWASLQKLPENMQALQKGLENLQVSTKEDLQMLRADLEERVPKAWNTPEMPESKENLVEVENQAGRTVETNTSWGQESMREEMEKILSEKLAVLQRQLEMTQQAIPPMKEMTNTWASLQKLPENMQALQKGLENLQVSTKEDLQMLRADLEERVPKAWNVPEMSESKESLVEVENQAGFFKIQRYKVDVTLNADTAHPRLEVSEDGKSVTDTGVIRQVPSKEERFDSHTFVLAKEGYTSGRQYFEVDVGKRRNWILGVASESVARKGIVTLSPKNGFWVIGLADGEEYWAHTDPWTRLTVSGKPEKIGIFLNISANKLSFYNAKKKTALYTFTSIGGSRLERKFVPFFSTGSGVSVYDSEPLKIVQEFDDDD
ncbi:cingulin isoform X10 [Gallus gallus]|uniref:cingulin isoform X10 n=1 Tax=Gallus gallus TaxID=9031 RepID=UPI001AE18F9C|nr:cingulin isoform X10 [Gallus gallus]